MSKNTSSDPSKLDIESFQKAQEVLNDRDFQLWLKEMRLSGARVKQGAYVMTNFMGSRGLIVEIKYGSFFPQQRKYSFSVENGEYHVNRSTGPIYHWYLPDATAEEAIEIFKQKIYEMETD